MSLTERLHRQLISARQTSERLLEAFETPDQWTYQVHPQSNHALWFVGHMATTDNFFVSLLAPDRGRDMPGYAEWFGMGSRPVRDPSAYPSVDQVRDSMRERRAALLETLNQMTDQQLDQPMPKETPSFLPDVASVFEMALWHEGLHCGQLSVVRRALGHRPLVDGASPDA